LLYDVAGSYESRAANCLIEATCYSRPADSLEGEPYACSRTSNGIVGETRCVKLEPFGAELVGVKVQHRVCAVRDVPAQQRSKGHRRKEAEIAATSDGKRDSTDRSCRQWEFPNRCAISVAYAARIPRKTGHSVPAVMDRKDARVVAVAGTRDRFESGQIGGADREFWRSEANHRRADDVLEELLGVLKIPADFFCAQQEERDVRGAMACDLVAALLHQADKLWARARHHPKNEESSPDARRVQMVQKTVRLGINVPRALRQGPAEPTDHELVPVLQID
jgi:hypothetical protein